MAPAARLKSVTIAFGEGGAGKWTTDVDIRGGDGPNRHMSATVIPDGSVARVEGDTSEADTVAVTVPSPDVLVMVLATGEYAASARVHTVSPDGLTMIETAGYSKDGKPFIRTNYFTRIDEP